VLTGENERALPADAVSTGLAAKAFLLSKLNAPLLQQDPISKNCIF